MKPESLLLTTAIFFLLCTNQSISKNFYVDATNGDNAIADGTKEKPFRQIATLLIQRDFPVKSGDVIHLATGIYTSEPDEYGLYEKFPISLPSGVFLIGENPGGVIVDGGNLENVPSVFEISGPVTISKITINSNYKRIGVHINNNGNAVIDSCVISNNKYGIKVDGRAEIINNTIRNNSCTEDGAGIRISYDSYALIRGNIFMSNSTGNHMGGGIFCRSSNSVVIEGNTFIGNSAKEGAGISIYATDVLINNNLFINNISESFGSGFHCHGGNFDIMFCTFINNISPQGTISFNTDENSSISNCIIDGSKLPDNTMGSGLGLYSTSYGIPKIFYNIFGENEKGVFFREGDTDYLKHAVSLNLTLKEARCNISADPKTTNPLEGKYDLLPNSPCIDAATDFIPGVEMPTTDILGRPRPHGYGYDIGAYEYGGEVPTPIPPTPTVTLPPPLNPTPTQTPIPEPQYQLPVYRNSVEFADFSENGILEIKGTFANLYYASVSVTDDIPADEKDIGVEGNALLVETQPGEGTFLLFGEGEPVHAIGKVLVRASIWTSSPTTQIFVGVIDTNKNGDLTGMELGMDQLTVSESITETWGYVSALHESQSGYVKPFVQVVGNLIQSETYIDNVELYVLEEDGVYEGRFLGVNKRD